MTERQQTPILARRLSDNQLQRLGHAWGVAFANDPLYRYLQPEAAQRTVFLEEWMRAMARYGLRHAQLYLTPEPLRGGAIWEAPHAPALEVLGMLRAGILRPLMRLDWRTIRQLMDMEREMETLRRQQPPHWYLSLLGVHPSAQGQGFGSALLQPGLQAADRQGLPCYLETMTEADVRFCQKSGFEVVTQRRLPNAAPYWTMRRAPQPVH